MAAGLNWAALPSVLVVDILSYLSHEDRLKATSTCKRWRNYLFHPSLWHKVHFELCPSKRQKTRFLIDRCGRFVREVIIKFNSHNITEVKETSRILSVLEENKSLQCLTLLPSSCHIEWPDTQFPHIIDRFLDSIETIIRNSRKLQHISLGCVEELLEHSNVLIDLLGRRHAHTLKSLHVSTVKEDTENYGLSEVDSRYFDRFSSLKHLSIDYDYLTNSLLESFIDKRKAQLEKLIIHVHGFHSEQEKVTNETWRMLKNHSPKLEVTMNFIHSEEGVASMLHILQPSLPLAHLRQFFCTRINTAAINYMTTHYRDSLQSVYIMDGLIDGNPNLYYSHTEEDPFVMLAWQCKKLQDLTIVGYEITDEDVIAVSRLRGRNLKSFNIPHCCIVSVDEDEQTILVGPEYVGEEFIQKVSENMTWDWYPVEDEMLPHAVFYDEADAETAYMKILLNDQSGL